MRNQRGEVVVAVMVVMMVVMMIFGGTHLMHGGHQFEGDHQQTAQKHNHDEDVREHMHNHAGGQDPVPSQDETK